MVESDFSGSHRAWVLDDKAYHDQLGIVEWMARRNPPEVVPVLSRGKHRSPRKGACFMEYASFLAGEAWSDHPRCTHPLLAEVVRGVNDYTADTSRSRLIGLIPTVIGVIGDDPRVDAMIAVRCAAFALPVAAEHRQRALAVGLTAGLRVLAEFDDASAVDDRGLSEHVDHALTAAPNAARWAEGFASGSRLTLHAFQRRAAPTVVRCAITGIAEACIADPDRLLYELSVSVIGDCAHLLGATASSDSDVTEMAGATP